MQYTGYLDAVRYRTVIGWAHNLMVPETPPVLRIQLNGRDCGLTIADRPRPDLALAGITPLPRGFEWPIPDSVETVNSVKVLTVEGGVVLPSSESPICGRTNRPLPSEWSCGKHYRLPSFFILGAAKCGTSSLHRYLGQHPEICMSDPKEPFYFEAEYNRGPAYYFNRYFGHWAGETVVGEARHRNLYLPYTAERISRFNPEARLIVSVRHPVERAVSHWWHLFSRGREQAPFRQAIEQDWDRIQAGINFDDPDIQEIYARSLVTGSLNIFRTYIDSGYYFDQVQRYLAHFPASQLFVILLEELAADPAGVTARLFEFLGVDPSFQCDYTPLNQSASGVTGHLDGATLEWLAGHYRPHNSRLAEWLGRSLDSWDRVPSGLLSSFS